MAHMTSFGVWNAEPPLNSGPLFHSIMLRGSPVPFPEFTGERVYMQPFIKAGGEVLLPAKLARWLPTVTAMLDRVETPARMFLMIDQSEFLPGNTHRRPGAHIDGSWSESGKEKFNPNEWLILAADVEGCIVYLGEYSAADIGPGGDCSKMDLSGMKRVCLTPGYAYIGTVSTIHESVPIWHARRRTVVRINAAMPPERMKPVFAPFLP